MTFLFIVQGEGRGHITQAISLSKILRKNGHILGHVVVGKSKRRELPTFFTNQVGCEVTLLESPNFVTDKKGKSVNLFKTIFVNLLKLRTFIRSSKKLDVLIQQHQPDVVVNFYDFLGGFYFLIKKRKVKHIAIAHQFFISHPTFEYPKSRWIDRISMQVGNKLAGFRASKKLVLAFKQYPSAKESIVVPPLLREEIKNQPTSQREHFLVYMVNHGYADQVQAFHEQHPEIPIHCFWDKKGVPDEYSPTNNLTFHQLNDKKFIEYMASCKGYLTTAGFESVCEAMYMGKPILMVPVKGHFEQKCNAADATQAGAGISSEFFDLDLLLDYIPEYKNVQQAFQAWCAKTEELFIKNLTDVN